MRCFGCICGVELCDRCVWHLTTSVNLQFSVTIPRSFISRRYACVDQYIGVRADGHADSQFDGRARYWRRPGAGNSDVTVQVTGNAGNVTLTAATGTPNLVTVATTCLGHVDATSPRARSPHRPSQTPAATVLTATAGVVNLTGSWRYAWTNPAATTFAAGTYAGTGHTRPSRRKRYFPIRWTLTTRARATDLQPSRRSSMYLRARRASLRVHRHITAGSRTIYLQVGVGTSPGRCRVADLRVNATVNVVSVTVPTAQVGTGAAQAMTTNSTAANSFWDNFAFCAPPAQLYVAGSIEFRVAPERVRRSCERAGDTG